MKMVEPIRYVKLKASGRLPSPKGLALAIVRLLQQDDYKIDDLVRLVKSDPAISGVLLKFSNAASFGHSRPLVSLPEAVTTLGAVRIRALVLAFSVLKDHRSGHCHQFNYEQFWSRALATAISSQTLATYAKISSEENFTAGLLCSLGELALASIYPERYGEIITASADDIRKRLALEQNLFGHDHRELNATLLLEWGLPELLVNAVYHSEIPDEADSQEGSRVHGITLTLHVALAMANICVADESARWALLPNLYAKAARLRISTEEMNSLSDEIIASWHDWGAQLKIQTREITSFADILSSSQPRRNQFDETVCLLPNNQSALLISDNPADTSEIAQQLATNGFTVKFSSNTADGLTMAMGGNHDLIILEMSAPEIDGANFCRSLRANTHREASYIVLIANDEHDSGLTQALEFLADDFILRPITPLALQTKLRGIFKILQLQNELIRERNGMVNSASEWARANRRLTHVAMTDPLTLLSNRRHGLDTFSAELEFAKSNNLPLSCLMIDIDHFKKINDSHGHKAGDAVLVTLATLLQADARSEDLVFRYGGEEFCIICPGATLEMACIVAERIRQDVERQTFQLGNKDIAITASVGVALMSPSNEDKEALIHDADAALYHAKKSGRNRVCKFRY